MLDWFGVIDLSEAIQAKGSAAGSTERAERF
jgi:hypothetical protein